MASGFWSYLSRIVVLAGLYFAAGKLGLAMALEHGSVSPVWPPTGLALVALLVIGLPYWPGIAVGAFLVNVTTPVPSPIISACMIAAGNTLEAVIAAWLLKRADFHFTFDRLRDVLALIIFGAILSTMASATVGVLTLCLGNSDLWSHAGRLWWQWWVGDAMGDLVVAPVLLIWGTRPRIDEFVNRGIEALLLGGGLLSVGYLIFGRTFDVTFLDNSYWLFPFLIWAALRFGPRGVVTALALVSALAIIGTTNGNGPFVREAVGSLVLLQMFLGIATITGLILASITTERAHANQALHHLNDELEQRVVERTGELAESNRLLCQKNEENETFVYSVSHDLRSPLVNLQGFSQELSLVGQDLRNLLGDRDIPENLQKRGMALLDEDMTQSINFIHTGVIRLSSIIDSLLRLSRVGRVEYRMQHVDLNATVARVVESLQSTIAESGTTVTVADLPPVWGDATAVEQIFANLIGNALNYLNPKRPGDIRVGCNGAASGVAAINTYYVEDNGLGIPELHRAKLFQAFQRLHPEIAKGEGLGLTIVRRMVERHGGRIWVESSVDFGSTFFVALPNEPPQNGKTKSAPARAVAANSKEPTQ